MINLLILHGVLSYFALKSVHLITLRESVKAALSYFVCYLYQSFSSSQIYEFCIQ